MQIVFFIFYLPFVITRACRTDLHSVAFCAVWRVNSHLRRQTRHSSIFEAVRFPDDLFIFFGGDCLADKHSDHLLCINAHLVIQADICKILAVLHLHHPLHRHQEVKLCIDFKCLQFIFGLVANDEPSAAVVFVRPQVSADHVVVFFAVDVDFKQLVIRQLFARYRRFADETVPVEGEVVERCVISQFNRECPFFHVTFFPNSST